jgi:hypothetical protein
VTTFFKAAREMNERGHHPLCCLAVSDDDCCGYCHCDRIHMVEERIGDDVRELMRTEWTARQDENKATAYERGRQAVLRDPAVAKITQTSRWVYSFYISQGITKYAPASAGCWSAIGSRKHAERKAARKLAGYNAMNEKMANRVIWEVGS